VIYDAINPKTNQRVQIKIDVSEHIATAARLDFAVAEFVADLAKEKLPIGYLLLGTDFRTP
jgi:hypothetical protein